MDAQNQQVSVSATGLPGRYASALFDLASQENQLDQTASDLGKIEEALNSSADFTALLAAPQISRKEAGAAVAAIAEELGLASLTRRFLGVLAENRRLAELPAVIREFQATLSVWRGNLSAQIITAHPLSADQRSALKAKLQERTGREMDMSGEVDPSILGGLIVRIGSEQIDSSVRTRLERLGQQMKG